MISIQILYEDDHRDRAVALKNALINDADVGPVKMKAIKIPGLKTLIFWGHGQSSVLCKLNSKAIIATIIEWKKLNDGLKSVEIVTCNARHFDGAYWEATVTVHQKSKLMHLISGDQINNSMAKQVKRGLKYNINPSYWGVKVYAFPESVHGSFRMYSILYWDSATASWCYVTGPTEPDMFRVGTCINYTKKARIDPKTPNLRYDDARTGEYSLRVSAAKIDFPSEDYADVIAGRAADLRDYLEEVK